MESRGCANVRDQASEGVLHIPRFHRLEERNIHICLKWLKILNDGISVQGRIFALQRGFSSNKHMPCVADLRAPEVEGEITDQRSSFKAVGLC